VALAAGTRNTVGPSTRQRAVSLDLALECPLCRRHDSSRIRHEGAGTGNHLVCEPKGMLRYYELPPIRTY
jgi:hypothetical protein